MNIDEDMNLENESQLRIPDGLACDLKQLLEPVAPVPAHVDRAVMDKVNQRLVRRGSRRLWRWAGSVAAAAAVIILVFALNTSDERASTQMADKLEASRTSLAAAGLAPDIDGNGRVDILDAFKLARRIEAGESSNQRWDMNGDGLVNRADIDTVALVAVKLDKGVL